jgi:transcriptional regulator with XRE-family HTH domain
MKAVQPVLFDVASDPLAKVEQRHLSGEGIRQRNPALFDAVQRMCAAGMSCRLVAGLSGLSKNTVAQIAQAGVGTAQANKRLADMARANLTVALDEMQHRLETGQMKDSDRNVAIGILMQHLPQLDGVQQTLLVKHEHSAPQFAGLLDELRSKMGLTGPDAGANARALDQVVDVIPVTEDMESPASVSRDREGRRDDTVSATLAHPTDRGGEGVEAQKTGSPLAMDPTEPKS